MVNVAHISGAVPVAPRVAVVVSRYNRRITDALERGAIEALERATGGEGRAEVIPVPGAFELPSMASIAATLGEYDAIVCLGCIIRGETSHDRHIAGAVAGALAHLGMGLCMPVTFGVLTVDHHEQAEARAGGPMGNKGADAMEAALHCLGIIEAMQGTGHEAEHDDQS